jgi:MFS-type transporter involved in bile tolerance (Atg22 family)
MLFVALTSPLLGAVADRSGLRKLFLVFYTVLCIGSVALFTTLEPGQLAWGFAIAVLANIGFEGALVFYNAYLPEIAPPEKRGFISGLGFGLGYAGSAVGLLTVMPLVKRSSSISPGSRWPSLRALSLPALRTSRGRPAQVGIGQALGEGLHGFRRLTADM